MPTARTHLPRQATADDIAEMVRVVNAAYEVERTIISGPRLCFHEAVERLTQGSALVIDRLEAPRGLCAVVFLSMEQDHGYLGPLAVDPVHQGQGLARRLVQAVEKRCMEAGCRFMDITVVNRREELFPFYERLGFQPSGKVPFHSQERMLQPIHLVKMTKRL